MNLSPHYWVQIYLTLLKLWSLKDLLMETIKWWTPYT